MQLSSEAKSVLVESYVALRRGDSTPGTRVAYRMTVRQLEALIRLSEAIARSHLENVVSKHPWCMEHNFFYTEHNDLAGTEQGSESHQKKKLVITEEHFQRVTQALVMRLRQHEEAVARDGNSI
ncbi:hypothetical protein BHE74_00014780 [Ensete ventricosum]|nr:hypothetical protein GW17_00011966 [Ensete ventricosum]RWW77086.1 hypothetical protein BHE74_00014780 [Ensete ventricosum]